MSSFDGKMPTGTQWKFEAWSESMGSHWQGAPSFWSIYSFDTLKETQRERDRLEKVWSKKHWKKSWGARDGGPYSGFEIYCVETTHVPRSKKR